MDGHYFMKWNQICVDFFFFFFHVLCKVCTKLLVNFVQGMHMFCARYARNFFSHFVQGMHKTLHT